MDSPAVELQRAVFAALTGDARVTALCGQRVYDRVPDSCVFPYVSFGAGQAVEDGADCIEMGEHFLQIDVWSRKPGKIEAKNITHAIKRVLHRAQLTLSVHGLAMIEVEDERHFMDSDGLTVHGVVSVRAIIEDNDDG